MLRPSNRPIHTPMLGLPDLWLSTGVLNSCPHSHVVVSLSFKPLSFMPFCRD
jgi:hypothetical protein